MKLLIILLLLFPVALSFGPAYQVTNPYAEKYSMNADIKYVIQDPDFRTNTIIICFFRAMKMIPSWIWDSLRLSHYKHDISNILVDMMARTRTFRNQPSKPVAKPTRAPSPYFRIYSK